MCKTTRRDMYRAAALTGLLANSRLACVDYDANVQSAVTIGDMMESRAKADYEERENGNGKREEPAERTCATCRFCVHPLPAECRGGCRDYSLWQPRERKEDGDVHASGV